MIILQNIQCSYSQPDINIYSNDISYAYCYNINTETQAQCNSQADKIMLVAQSPAYLSTIYWAKISVIFFYMKYNP